MKRNLFDELNEGLQALRDEREARRLGSNAQHNTIKQPPTLGITAQPTKQ